MVMTTALLEAPMKPVPDTHYWLDTRRGRHRMVVQHPGSADVLQLTPRRGPGRYPKHAQRPRSEQLTFGFHAPLAVWRRAAVVLHPVDGVMYHGSLQKVRKQYRRLLETYRCMECNDLLDDPVLVSIPNSPLGETFVNQCLQFKDLACSMAISLREAHPGRHHLIRLDALDRSVGKPPNGQSTLTRSAA